MQDADRSRVIGAKAAQRLRSAAPCTVCRSQRPRPEAARALQPLRFAPHKPFRPLYGERSWHAIGAAARAGLPQRLFRGRASHPRGRERRPQRDGESHHPLWCAPQSGSPPRARARAGRGKRDCVLPRRRQPIRNAVEPAVARRLRQGHLGLVQPWISPRGGVLRSRSSVGCARCQG